MLLGDKSKPVIPMPWNRQSCQHRKAGTGVTGGRGGWEARATQWGGLGEPSCWWQGWRWCARGLQRRDRGVEGRVVERGRWGEGGARGGVHHLWEGGAGRWCGRTLHVGSSGLRGDGGLVWLLLDFLPSSPVCFCIPGVILGGEVVSH